MAISIQSYITKYNISNLDAESIFKVIRLCKSEKTKEKAVEELVKYLMNTPLYPRIRITAKVNLINLLVEHHIPIESIYESSLKNIVDNLSDIDNLLRLANVITAQATGQEIEATNLIIDLSEFMNYLNNYLAEHYEEIKDNFGENSDTFEQKYKAAIQKFHMFHRLELFRPIDMLIAERMRYPDIAIWY